MAIEIEKKFIVKNDNWKNFVSNKFIIKQAYLTENNQIRTRIRITPNKAYLTLKVIQINISRTEFEYQIPINDAKYLFSMSNYQIFKTRYILNHFNDEWVVDVFEKNHLGLIIAEIELKSENQKFKVPTWIGKDISTDKKYSNFCLAKSNKIPKLD